MIYTLKKYWLPILIFVFVLIVLPLTLFLAYQRQILRKRAEAIATIHLNPANLTTPAAVGASFDVNVTINAGAEQIVSANVVLNFDASLLEVICIGPNQNYTDCITKGPSFDTQILPNVDDTGIDNPNGRVRMTYAIISGAPATGESILFATLRFRTKAQGTAAVALGPIRDAAHPDGIEIGRVSGGGNIYDSTNSTGGTYQIGQTGANQPPEITTTSLPDATQGRPYFQSDGITPVTIVASDPDGDPITLSWAPTGANDSLPEGLLINSSSGEISGTPLTAGAFNITITVSDNRTPAGTASKDFVLTIAESSTPLLINFYPYCGPEGAALVIRGIKFGQTQGTGKITFVNKTNSTLTKDAVDYLVWNDNLIIVKVPPAMPSAPLANGQVDKEAKVQVVLNGNAYEAPTTPSPKYFNPQTLYQTNVADLNCDGVVNDTDFSVLFQSWTH